MIKFYIPYNNDKDCVYREQAFSVVYKYYSSIENFDVKILSSTPFSRAASRNAVFKDKIKDSDIIFFSDADIIVPKEQVIKAVERAKELDEMVLSYNLLSKMNVDETNEFIRSGKLQKSRKTVKFQCSGSFAISFKLFKEIGGYDERFYEWGCEDRVFYYSAAFLRGRTYCERLKGDAFHLYHPRSENASKKAMVENILHREYLDAFGISIDSLRKNKNPDNNKILNIKKNSLNGTKKEIISFKCREVLRFRKDRKVALCLKGSEQYKRLLKSKEYICEGAVI